MASAAPSASSLRTKRYILAALAVIFAATTITIVVSAILSPAEINFSIVNSSCSSSTAGVRLDLTLAANNTSHRAGVRYSNATLAYLEYTDHESTEHKVSADNITMPLSQAPGRTINIAVSSAIPANLWDRDFTGQNGTSHATLVKLLVIAEVRFKVGPAHTVPHIIRLLCDPKDYFSGTQLSSPVNCSAA